MIKSTGKLFESAMHTDLFEQSLKRGFFQHPVRLSASPPSLPQYVEVPPNIEAKRSIS